MSGVRHIHDAAHHYNGSFGEWTVCGEPWEPDQDGPECTECRAVQEIEQRLREAIGRT